MKKFKVGQTVYYYLESYGIGRIISCEIKRVTKDLTTGEISYIVLADENHGWTNNRTLTSDYLYASEKQIMKEHKDAIACRVLEEKLDSLIKALKAGFVKYPLDCPDDCYKYKVECLYYNQNKKRFYIYAADGVGELFAEDYGKIWGIVE